VLRRSHWIAVAVVVVIGWSLYARLWVYRPVTKEPISVEAGTVIVENQSEREWRNVVVTVNDHFHGGVSVLAAGGRLDAPLSQLATSHGQKYDRGRQSVTKIEVKATEPDGTIVRLRWLARTTS
jgi:hypothetical protein